MNMCLYFKETSDSILNSKYFLVFSELLHRIRLQSSVNWQLSNFEHWLHLVCIWQPLKTDKRPNFDENGKKGNFVCSSSKNMSPSISMGKMCFTEFLWRRTSTKDAEFYGHPIEVATVEKIEKVLEMMLVDQRLKVR